MIIAFEGIDACGKSTQIRMLEEQTELNGFSSKVFSYPNYETDTGKKILELLKAPKRDPLVLQTLMTVNRYENQTEIDVAQRMGMIVILDRYWLSGLVYGLSDGLPLSWLLNVHNRLIQPDQWIVLDISVEESFRRRPVRDDAYEASEQRMKFCRQQYCDAQDSISDLSIVNAMQAPKVVHDQIFEILGQL
jgi:dTMP kinase